MLCQHKLSNLENSCILSPRIDRSCASRRWGPCHVTVSPLYGWSPLRPSHRPLVGVLACQGNTHGSCLPPPACSPPQLPSIPAGHPLEISPSIAVACGICGHPRLPQRSVLLPHPLWLAVGVGYAGLVEGRCLRDLEGTHGVLRGAWQFLEIQSRRSMAVLP